MVPSILHHRPLARAAAHALHRRPAHVLIAAQADQVHLGLRIGASSPLLSRRSGGCGMVSRGGVCCCCCSYCCREVGAGAGLAVPRVNLQLSPVPCQGQNRTRFKSSEITG